MRHASHTSDSTKTAYLPSPLAFFAALQQCGGACSWTLLAITSFACTENTARCRLAPTLRLRNSCILVLHNLHQPCSLGRLFTELSVRVLVVFAPLLFALLKLDIRLLPATQGQEFQLPTHMQRSSRAPVLSLRLVERCSCILEARVFDVKCFLQLLQLRA